MNGWILLHKKIWENPRFFKNYKAIVVWVWLLTHCNGDGVVTCGRQQIAEACGINESCVYRVLKNFSLKYLENEPILNIKSNNRFSVIRILKWSELQRKSNSRLNNERTTSEQRVNTNKEERRKNKETILALTSDELNSLKEKFPTKNVLEEYDKALDWLSSSGKTYKDYPAFFRNWLRRSEDSTQKGGYVASDGKTFSSQQHLDGYEKHLKEVEETRKRGLYA